MIREVSLAELPPTKIPPSLVDTPSRPARAREQDERLQQAMQELPEHYRQIILLRSYRDLTFVQIAERLGTTADAVRKLWERAIEKLAKSL